MNSTYVCSLRMFNPVGLGPNPVSIVSWLENHKNDGSVNKNVCSPGPNIALSLGDLPKQLVCNDA
jgi:hypothetical protein